MEPPNLLTMGRLLFARHLGCASHSSDRFCLFLCPGCRAVWARMGTTGGFRIIEWFGLEGTLRIIWFQPSCHEQGHLPPAQVAQSSISLFQKDDGSVSLNPALLVLLRAVPGSSSPLFKQVINFRAVYSN